MSRYRCYEPSDLHSGASTSKVEGPFSDGQKQIASTRPSKILPLPEDVAAQISSSTAIPTFTSVVIGLLENSLDAGAKEVDIGVDFGRASCTVEDDGDGILSEEFTKEGGLGKRFYTSKYKSPKNLYGGQGTFLSSVAALSILSVTSRPYNDSQSTLVLHHSRPAARFLRSHTSSVSLLHGHGTRVTVQNLFGNMPVRVKQRNAASLDDAKYETKEFEHLKQSIAAVLLSFHKTVHIFLHQAKGGGLERKAHIGPKAEHNLDAKLDLSNSTIDIPLLCKILTHVGYIEPSEWDSWVKTSARTLDIRIQGAISLQPAPSKRVQFMSLGNRPLNLERGHNILYEEVNRQFALSTFGNQDKISDGENLKESKDRRYKLNGYTKKQLKGRGKGVDRWPMFYIRIDLGEQNEVRKLEREAILNKVIEVLGAMIYGFLKTNHLRPHAIAKPILPSPAICGKRSNSKRAVNADNAFSSWSRIKTSNRAEPSALTHPKAAAQKPHGGSTDLVSTTRIPDSTKAQNPLPLNGAGEELIEWTNPISKVSVLINSRTGLAIAHPKLTSRPATAPAELQRPNAAFRLTRPTSRGFITPQKGSWTDDLLSKWENPVFALPTEVPISQVSFKDPHLEVCRTNYVHNPEADISKAIADSISTLSTRLSKASIRSAHIIAQVDKKFILMSVSTPQTPRLLILVDQHAADERIRVEGLLHDLQTQASVPITKPLVFDIPAREYDLFTSHAPIFARWGITYTFMPSDKKPATTTARLIIQTLPPTIASRCQTDPHLLISLLRTEVWSLHTSSSSSASVPSSLSSSILPPPQGIMDLLNSRACRSAIMFNDALTPEEAMTLVSRLAETQRPWVCAHGRPSMVPIVDVGGASERAFAFGGGRGEDGMGVGLLGRSWRNGNGNGNVGVDNGAGMEEVPFREAWMKWKGKGKGKGGKGGDECVS